MCLIPISIICHERSDRGHTVVIVASGRWGANATSNHSRPIFSIVSKGAAGTSGIDGLTGKEPSRHGCNEKGVMPQLHQRESGCTHVSTTVTGIDTGRASG